MEVSKGQCGTLVVRGKNQRKIDSGVVAWMGGVKFTTQKDGEEFNVVACEEHEKRKADDGSETEKPGYHGMFATNFDISEHEVASEVVAWGRRGARIFAAARFRWLKSGFDWNPCSAAHTP